MKTWRQPLLSFFALLAMLLPLLPQAAWACPMTGRIVKTLMVCAAPVAMAAPSAKAHACCPRQKKATVAVKSAVKTIAKSTHAGCTNPGGPCCKFVRLPGKSHTAPAPSGASLDAPVLNSGHTGPLVAVLADVPSLTPLTFVRNGDYPSATPLTTQHYAPHLSGRAPPIS